MTNPDTSSSSGSIQTNVKDAKLSYIKVCSKQTDELEYVKLAFDNGDWGQYMGDLSQWACNMHDCDANAQTNDSSF